MQDLLGYRNLCALITLARLERERGSPRLSYEQLFARAGGLTALSGCHHGAIPAALARDDTMAARRLLKRFVEVFGSDFYLEVGNHFITQEALIVRQIIEMSSSTGVSWVVTNNVHYATSEKRIVHDVLTCLKHKVTLSNAGTRLRPNGSWYMKSPQEMTHLWRDNLIGIKNTLAISERYLKMLAKAGAFESFCPGRRQALWRVLSLLRPRRSMPLLEALIANASGNIDNSESEAELEEEEVVVREIEIE